MNKKRNEWLQWMASLLGPWWGWVAAFLLFGLLAGLQTIFFFIVMVGAAAFLAMYTQSPAFDLWLKNTKTKLSEWWQKKPN